MKRQTLTPVQRAVNPPRQSDLIQTLAKGEEKYILVYDAEHVGEAYRQLGRWAANPELSFSWLDAAVWHGQIRRASEEECA